MHRFDSISAQYLQGTSLKWSAYPGKLGMWVAEMDFGVDPTVAAALKEYSKGAGIGYRSGKQADELREATASWIGDTTGWYPEKSQIFLSPDVVSAFRVTIDRLTRKGSQVILPTPAYMSFVPVPEQQGRELIQVPCKLVAGRYELDLDGIKAGLDAGAGLVVLVNPSNPTGRVYERAEVEALVDLVAQYDARIFADEIHASFVYEGEHIPVASLSETAARLTVTATAASKGWNIPGLKSAQMILTNPDDEAKLGVFKEILDEVSSTVGTTVSTVAYRDARAWNEEVRDYLRESRDLLEERIGQIEGVTMAHAEGTYIAFLDFTGAIEAGVIPRDRSVSSWLRSHAGVALTNGTACGAGFENFARIVYSCPRPVLAQALDAIEAALTEADED